MASMGCKVTGASGQAALNTLRALKLITIDKQGIKLVKKSKQ